MFMQVVLAITLVLLVAVAVGDFSRVSSPKQEKAEQEQSSLKSFK